jgi:uncharacterized metal-binding protein
LSPVPVSQTPENSRPRQLSCSCSAGRDDISGCTAKQSAATLEAEIEDAEQVIVIDGCTDCCATKKLSKSCLTPHHHIIATELGIEKNGMGEVQYDEIEKVVVAVDQKITGG